MLQYPIHGGDLTWARRHFPQWSGEWLDLSTGINPVAYPIPQLPPSDWARLPSQAAEEALIAAAAAFYGVRGDGLLAVPGSQAAIQIFPHLAAALDSQKTVEIVTPTYGEHSSSWHKAGFRVVPIDGMTTEIPPPAAPFRVVVSPNNPTGREYPNDLLCDWAERCAARGGFLLVDEAFADVAAIAVTARAGGCPGLVVLRSFGKFFGLAGVRLGFVAAAAERIAALRERIGPWAISGPALTIGRIAFSDQAWIAATKMRLRQDAAAMRQFLAAQNFPIVGHTDLFTLVAHDHAAAIFTRWASQGILLRAFAPALHKNAAHWLRIGLPPDVGAFCHRFGGGY